MVKTKARKVVKKTTKKGRLNEFLPWILTVGGIIGLICSVILTLDEIQLLKNPNFKPNCDLNPIIACGNVMESWQAHIFGIPNPIIGIATFAVLITVGVSLLSGAKYKRWFWLGLNGGTLLGLIMVHWLFFQTVYGIRALCPYCMVVWVVTITTFWYTTLYNLQQGHLKLPKSTDRAVAFVQRHHLDILVIWFVVIAALILKHFWYYYGHYFF